MGTDKRERQKQNRQLRLESAAKEQQREKTRRRALQIGGVIGAAVVVALLFAIFGGGGDDDEASTASDTTVALEESSTVVTETTATTMAPKETVTPGEAITGETPCPEEGAERVITFEQPPPMCIDPAKTYTATFAIELNGEPNELTVELDAATAPTTVNNFVTLARYGYFDGTVCHRAVPGFVVQCGDPTATGGGGPGYTFDDELPTSLDAYVRGAVAMANSGPDTNGSQFFFVTSDDASVRFGSPNYSVFGQVEAGGLDTTLAAMSGFAQDNEQPSGLIQIVSVTITES